jgi:hypothetical protein
MPLPPPRTPKVRPPVNPTLTNRPIPHGGQPLRQPPPPPPPTEDVSVSAMSPEAFFAETTASGQPTGAVTAPPHIAEMMIDHGLNPDGSEGRPRPRGSPSAEAFASAQSLTTEQLVNASEARIAREGVPEGFRPTFLGQDSRAYRQRQQEQQAAQNQPAQAQRQQPPAAQAPSSDLDDFISSDLLAKLEAEIGLNTTVTYPLDFARPGAKPSDKPIHLEIRQPAYDDYMWAAGALQRRLSDLQDGNLSETEAEQYISHIVGVRCIVSLDGAPLVSLLKMEGAIRQVDPTWDGGYETIPQAMFNEAVVKFYKWARKHLHPDFLFTISEEIKAIDRGERGKGPKKTPSEDQNPT